MGDCFEWRLWKQRWASKHDNLSITMLRSLLCVLSEWNSSSQVKCWAWLVCFRIFQMEVLCPINWNSVDIRKLTLPIRFLQACLLWSYRIKFSWYFRNFIYIICINSVICLTWAFDLVKRCKLQNSRLRNGTCQFCDSTFQICNQFTDGRSMLTKHPPWNAISAFFITSWRSVVGTADDVLMSCTFVKTWF